MQKRQIKAQQAVKLGVDSSVAPPGRPPATREPADCVQDVPPVAKDVPLLVKALVAQAAAAVSGSSSPAQAAASAPGLANCLCAVSNPTLLALASDEELSELLSALRPLLRCCDSTGRWVVPAVADALQPLQNTCQVRAGLNPLPQICR
jgi:hypothetical protein